MRRTCLSVGVSIAFVAAVPTHGWCQASPSQRSAPARKRFNAELLELELSTRIEQHCNERAMKTVRSEHWPMDPDEGVVAAFAEPEQNGTKVHAAGAAIRSRGDWYHIAFDCVTSDDGLVIKDFRYLLGPVVPRSEWKEHNLVAP
jgi:hypothetical protein